MDTKKKTAQWGDLGYRLVLMVVASLLFAINLKSFVQAGDLFPGGFNGITRLIQRCALEFGGVELPFGPINLVLNALPVFVGLKFVGKKFTLYSCIVIVLTSVFTDMLPSMPITEDVLLICVFGGIISGFAGSLTLRARVCAGGTDFIAIALAEHKNVDAWNYILAGNVVVLAIAGLLFGWDHALYSIIYQYAATQVIRLLDPEGRRATLLIITGREQAGGVCAQIQDTHHSATLIEGVGLYNGSSCVLIYSVVTGSQVGNLTKKIRQSDPNAFINVLRTEKLSGNFYRHPRD